MSAPALPPRPPQTQNTANNPNNNPGQHYGAGPPVPALPVGYRPDIDGTWNTQPHYLDPLVAPRPQKLMSQVPAEMARSLESQLPGTPAPPNAAYGQPIPSISFNTPQMPGAYPPSPYPPAQQQGVYNGPAYGQGYNPNPALPGRAATASPLPYPGTPQPYQLQQQQSLAYTGLPPAGFIAQPQRFTPSPAPGPPPPLVNPPGPNLTPGFQPRPQSWGGAPTPSPGSGLHARNVSGGYGAQLAPGTYTPQPLQQQQQLQPQQQQQQQQPQSFQQNVQALGAAGIQAPPPNPYWVNGSTPPVSRPASSLSTTSPIAKPSSNRYNIDNSIAGLTFSDPAPSKSTGPPQLTVQLPTVASLSSAMNPVLSSRDAPSKVAWCKDVLSMLDRAIQANGNSIGDSPAKELLEGSAPGGQGISDADVALLKLSDAAVGTLMQLLAPPLPIGPNNAMPPFIAEALFLRGQVIAAGTFPERLPKSPRDAFRDFEASARGGYAPAWFKLGRDYETVGDLVRAKDCFERGVQRGVGSCFYRMGMAHLQGQLNLPQNPTLAMPLLQHAAYLSSIEVPQPAYVYALLLLQEFPHITLPLPLLQSLVPQSHPVPIANQVTAPPTLLSESKKYLERSAYLNFGPALYKLGQSYEHALPPFPYDPLMSVQYYSLASQQGDALADLALSKWFLVGSSPDSSDPNAPSRLAGESFDKDEALALVFAEKAASRGEAGGEFAMGYYCEVGIGRERDVKSAITWYQRAAKQGHADAKARLKDLEKENPRMLGVQDYQGRLERMRTNAKEKMKASSTTTNPNVPPLPGQSGASTAGGMLAPPPVSGANVMALARTSSRIQHAGSGRKGRKPVPESSGAPPPSDADAPKPSGSTTPTKTGASTVTGTPSSPGGKAKPATFEEMGYHSHKLEDKECIIM